MDGLGDEYHESFTTSQCLLTGNIDKIPPALF